MTIEDIEQMEQMIKEQAALGFDILLIIFCFYAAYNWGWFLGGFGWFLLLGLSPRAWR